MTKVLLNGHKHKRDINAEEITEHSEDHMFPSPGNIMTFNPDYPSTSIFVSLVLPEGLYITPENTDVARF